MPINTIVALLGPLLALAVGLTVATSDFSARRGLWLAPATAAVLFLGLSVVAIATEGPLGFATDHSRSWWGNQIWFDLLLSASTAFAALAPRARALGMRLVPWLLAVLTLGSIGLLAMAARVLFLTEKTSGAVAGARGAAPADA